MHLSASQAEGAEFESISISGPFVLEAFCAPESLVMPALGDRLCLQGRECEIRKRKQRMQPVAVRI